jgi:hypothetical protein
MSMLNGLNEQPMSLSLLRDTRIGDKLNKLVKYRKAHVDGNDFGSAEIRMFEECSALVKKWKQLAELQQQQVKPSLPPQTDQAPQKAGKQLEKESSVNVAKIPLIEQNHFLQLFEQTNTWMDLHNALTESLNANTLKIREQCKARMAEFHNKRSETTLYKASTGKLSGGSSPKTPSASVHTSADASAPRTNLLASTHIANLSKKRKFSSLLNPNKPKLTNIQIIKSKLGMK